MENLVELLRGSTTDAEDALIKMQQTGNVEATKVVFTHLQRSCDELRSIGHHQAASEFTLKGLAIIESQVELEKSMQELALIRQNGGFDAEIAYISKRITDSAAKNKKKADFTFEVTPSTNGLSKVTQRNREGSIVQWQEVENSRVDVFVAELCRVFDVAPADVMWVS